MLLLAASPSAARGWVPQHPARDRARQVGWCHGGHTRGDRDSSGESRRSRRESLTVRHFEPPKSWGYATAEDMNENAELMLDHAEGYIPNEEYDGTCAPGMTGPEEYGGAMDNAPREDLPYNEETGELEFWIADHAFWQMPFHYRFPSATPWVLSPEERLRMSGQLVDEGSANDPISMKGVRRAAGAKATKLKKKVEVIRTRATDITAGDDAAGGTPAEGGKGSAAGEEDEEDDGGALLKDRDTLLLDAALGLDDASSDEDEDDDADDELFDDFGLTGQMSGADEGDDDGGAGDGASDEATEAAADDALDAADAAPEVVVDVEADDESNLGVDSFDDQSDGDDFVIPIDDPTMYDVDAGDYDDFD